MGIHGFTVMHNCDAVGLLDAICCDPPYGIRAGARKSAAPLTCSEGNDRQEPKEGSRANNDASESESSLAALRQVIEETRATRIPKTQVYSPCDVINDLLDFSAEALRLRGRLVYLLPTRCGVRFRVCPVVPRITDCATRFDSGVSSIWLSSPRPWQSTCRSTHVCGLSARVRSF